MSEYIAPEWLRLSLKAREHILEIIEKHTRTEWHTFNCHTIRVTKLWPLAPITDNLGQLDEKSDPI